MSLCDEILRIDDRIRFVAHLDKPMKNLIEMKQRADVKTLTDESFDRQLFFEIGPAFLGMISRFEEFFGDLRNMRLKYDKVTIVFLRIPEAVIGLSIERGPVTPVLENIGRKYGTNF